jgi:hypothetical protein
MVRSTANDTLDDGVVANAFFYEPGVTGSGAV